MIMARSVALKPDLKSSVKTNIDHGNDAVLEQIIHLFHVKCCMNFAVAQMKNTKFTLPISIIRFLLKTSV